MVQPEVYLGSADKLFDGQGHLTSETTRDLLARYMAAFAEWIERLAPAAK